MQELIDKILLIMGLEAGDIPQSVIEFYLSERQSVYPDNECLVLHNTIVSLYEWLIRESGKTGSGGGSKKEKVGNTEVTLGDYNKSVDWKSALDDYLRAPWQAIPSCKDVLGAHVAGRVKVGGVRKDQIRSINRNKNIRTGGASEICGVKQPNLNRYRRTVSDSPFTIDEDDDCNC